MESQRLQAYAHLKWPVLLVLLGAAYGVTYFHFFGEGWLQGTDFLGGYRPAIMEAQGYGFFLPADGKEYPGLDAFLNGEIEALAPPPPGIQLVRPDNWGFRHLYLCKTLSVAWRLFGVTWKPIRVLHVLILATNLILVFYIMRVALNPRLSALLSALFGLLPYGIAAMGDIRDYWKTPFLLLSLLIMGALLSKRVKVGRYFGLAAGLGLVIGVGNGFRTDLLMCLPPALFVLALPRATRVSWKQRTAGVLLFSGVFTLVAWPVLREEGMGTDNAHLLLMGQARDSGVFMEMERASYERVFTKQDKFVQAMIDRYAKEHLASECPLRYHSPRARGLGGQIMRKLVLTFPADYFARLWASVAASLRICGFPGLIATIIVAVYVCVYQPRRGILLAIVILYFCSYPLLHFEPRHVFHLAVFPLFSLGLILQFAVGLVRRQRRLTLPPSPWGAAALAAFLVTSAAIYAGTSAIQQRHVESLAERLADLPAEPIRTMREVEDTWVYERTPERRPPSRHETEDWDYRFSYVVAEFKSRPVPRTFWVLYATANVFVNFSKEFTITPALNDAAGPTRCYFPVYEAAPTLPNEWVTPVPGGAWSVLKGLAFSTAMEDDFLGLYTVTAADEFELWPVFSVPPARADLVTRERFRVPLAPLRLDNGVMEDFEASPDWPLIQAQMMLAPPDAVRVYREAAESHPNDWQAQLVLSTALRTINAHAEAQAVYERALALEASQSHRQPVNRPAS